MKRTTFTMVELLLVMTVIGVLMALMFPALSAAKGRAKVTQVKAQMKELELAIKQCETNYGTLPALVPVDTNNASANDENDWAWLYDGNNGAKTDAVYYDELTGALTNTNSTAAGVSNPRGLPLLAPRTNGANWLDPWGERYGMAWDLYWNASPSPEDKPYDGKVRHDLIPFATSASSYVYASFVIWSSGPDKQVGNAGSSLNNDNLFSVDVK